MHSIFLCALIKEQLLSLTSALCLIQLEELYAVPFFRRAELTLCGKKWFFFNESCKSTKKWKNIIFFETGMFALMTTQETDPLHPFYFCRHSSQTLTLTYSCLPHSWNKFTRMPWEGEHVAKTVSVFDLTLKFSLPFPAPFKKNFLHSSTQYRLFIPESQISLHLCDCFCLKHNTHIFYKDSRERSTGYSWVLQPYYLADSPA